MLFKEKKWLVEKQKLPEGDVSEEKQTNEKMLSITKYDVEAELINHINVFKKSRGCTSCTFSHSYTQLY